MLIVNEDLILRKPEPKDAEFLYQFKNDRSVSKELLGFSIGFSYHDLEDWIESKRKSKDSIVWTIADRKNDKCIGHKGLYRIDYRLRMAETGMFIGDKSYWRKGIGTSVKVTVLNYAFNDLNIHRIESRCLAGNVKAQKLNEKCGFKREGILRDNLFRNGQYLDIEVWGLLDSEWQIAKEAFSHTYLQD